MITLICQTCKESFEVYSCRKDTAKYCCVLCRNIGSKGEHFSPNTEFKTGQKFSKERNKKIAKAHKGKPKPWLQKTYSKICEYCGEKFETKINSRRFCCKVCSNNGVERKIDPEVERIRRKKISRAMKGKIPANLKQNIKSNNSFRQKEMFDIVKKYFPDAKFNFYIKTTRSFRFLDTAAESKMLDFEYDGKVHLMKSVIEKDKVRKKELKELGWKRISINRKNFIFLENICEKLKKD